MKKSSMKQVTIHQDGDFKGTPAHRTASAWVPKSWRNTEKVRKFLENALNSFTHWKNAGEDEIDRDLITAAQVTIQPHSGTEPSIVIYSEGDCHRVENTPFRYVNTIPKIIPAGMILVHNHIKPVMPINRNGFRVWMDKHTEKHERCRCGWGDGVEHYRIRRA